MSAMTAVRWFLVMLPFLYPLQVLTMRNDFVPLPYLALFAIITTTFRTAKPVEISRRGGASLLDMFLGAFLLINLPWVVFEGLWSGFPDAVRVFIYFVVPPLLYFAVSRYATPRELSRLPSVLSWTAGAVGVELFVEKYYNFVLFSTSPFQVRNYVYVAQVGSGTELAQLANLLYRTPGILEHLHATATYLGIGTIAALYRYLSRRSKWRLLLFAVNGSALIVSGGRTALGATLVAATMLVLLSNRLIAFSPSPLRRGQSVRRGGLVSAVLVFGVVLVATLSYEPVRRIYVQMFTGELIGGGVTFFGHVVPVEIRLWVEAASEVPLAIPFGLGPGPGSLRAKLGMGSDDFFPVDVLGRYGLVGFVLFYASPLVLLGEVIYTLKRSRGHIPPEAALLLLFSASVVVLLMLTTVHSGALVRKSIYPWLFVAYGIGRHYLAPAPVTQPNDQPRRVAPLTHVS